MSVKDFKETWDILVSKYGLARVIVTIWFIVIFLFFPFNYFLIGSLLLTIIILTNVSKLKALQRFENICDYKYYYLQNPITILLTFLTNFVLFIFDILWTLLEYSLILFMWAKMNKIHSFIEILNDYDIYSSGTWYIMILEKIGWVINIIISIVPFTVFPLFWKKSDDEDYWISILTKKMMYVIDEPVLYITTIIGGACAAVIFGIWFALRKKPEDFCTDEEYKNKLIKTLKYNAYCLYGIIFVLIWVYGVVSIRELKLFVTDLVDKISKQISVD